MASSLLGYILNENEVAVWSISGGKIYVDLIKMRRRAICSVGVLLDDDIEAKEAMCG